MCGIAGIINLDGAPVDRAVLQAMTRTLEHRGPDGEGYEVLHGIGLGHRRLSIIDLTGGAQPMYSIDRQYLISFNGEIFNYLELREEFEKRGARFLTASDTEVILEGFRLYGTGLFERLNGQFAFALYSLKDREAFLVRDRMGEKPLYLAKLGSSLVFGSEVKAILAYKRHFNLSNTISADSFVQYLSLNYVPFHKTLLEDVRSLPPRSFVQIKGSEIAEHQYFSWAKPRERTINGQEVEELTTLLQNSAKLRLRSDVPVGIFLSGGFDSTLVAWAAEKIAKPKAFIAHFPTLNFSEKDNAVEVCERFGLPYDIVEINLEREDIPNLMEKLVFHGDAPLADSSALPVYLLSRHTSKQVKVVLSGDAGDEIFAGYLTYQATLLAKRMGPALRKLGSVLAMLVKVLPASNKKVGLLEKFERFVRNLNLPPAAAHFAWNGMFGAAEKLKLVHPDLLAKCSRLDTFNELAEKFELDLEQPTLKSLMLADQQGYLCQDILAKVDRMTMAHGLEARPVLMDPAIIEFGNSLPDSMLLKSGKGKQVLRLLYQSKLPWYPLDRRKQGFSIPIHLWFRSYLSPLLRDLSDGAKFKNELFDGPALAEIVRLHRSKKSNYGFELWGVLVGLIWSDRILNTNNF